MHKLLKHRILNAVFDLEEECLINCFYDDEKTTRKAIKLFLDDKLKNSRLPQNNHVIAQAYLRIQELTYDEIKTIVETLGPEGINNGEFIMTDDDYIAGPFMYYEPQVPLRTKVLKSNEGDRLGIINDDGSLDILELISRFTYKGTLYIEVQPHSRVVVNKGQVEPIRFYSFEQGLDRDGDVLNRVTYQKLLDELTVAATEARLQKEIEELAEQKALEEASKQIEEEKNKKPGNK